RGEPLGDRGANAAARAGDDHATSAEARHVSHEATSSVGRHRSFGDHRVVELAHTTDRAVAEPVHADVAVGVALAGGGDTALARVLDDELVGVDALVHLRDLE